jgi:hypothetical protein
VDEFSLLARISLPVRAADTAVSQPFPTPCGFRLRRGERRSAMPSQFENPVISLSKIQK